MTSLLIGPQLGRALQALDVGDQAFEVGEAVVVEVDKRAFWADVEFRRRRRRGS